MTERTDDEQVPGSEESQDITENAEKRDDIAENPGSDEVSHEHADAVADEWGEDSFPGSDPPAHY
ncbi:hypothetical protein [Leucobacter sp. NPDC077196]|uniref:hypothetical protein n=1 Tax=Leucobacter sp. NPDC077196 TaxID=3154959 RepID=UPI003440022F